MARATAKPPAARPHGAALADQRRTDPCDAAATRRRGPHAAARWLAPLRRPPHVDPERPPPSPAQRHLRSSPPPFGRGSAPTSAPQPGPTEPPSRTSQEPTHVTPRPRGAEGPTGPLVSEKETASAPTSAPAARPHGAALAYQRRTDPCDAAATRRRGPHTARRWLAPLRSPPARGSRTTPPASAQRHLRSSPPPFGRGSAPISAPAARPHGAASPSRRRTDPCDAAATRRRGPHGPAGKPRKRTRASA